MKKLLSVSLVLLVALSGCKEYVVSDNVEARPLHELQQEFVDLGFGMFIHFNIPTFSLEDWADPDMPVDAFFPEKLDCSQWAKAAKSANMTYGCLTTKHHSGYCIWDTKTTDYNLMNSPLGRDVVREYVDAFRAEDLKVMLYFSILDTHHRLRPGHITRKTVDMIKEQLHELLTNYGEITALIIDGWDAPWSRISYDDVPFEEFYTYIKSLQPNCLVMDLNSAKYPKEALFYTDIKSYEQGAGQHISTSENQLPALACLPLQRTWFWKESMPTDELKDVEWIVNENVKPYNRAYCNFILNVAPNRDGLMDDNALAALKRIGELYQNEGRIAELPECEAPIIAHNLAKNKPAESSWSYDMNICDFANDDNFHYGWVSQETIEKPYFIVEIGKAEPVNTITVLEDTKGSIVDYELSYRLNGKWNVIYSGPAPECRWKIQRFPEVKADAVKVQITARNGEVELDEVGVYNNPLL